jgi:hypothetical protein
LLYIQVKREDEASLYSQHQQNFEPSSEDCIADNVISSLSSETVLYTIANFFIFNFAKSNKCQYKHFAGLTIIRFRTALKYFDLICKISENQGLFFYRLA